MGPNKYFPTDAYILPPNSPIPYFVEYTPVLKFKKHQITKKILLFSNSSSENLDRKIYIMILTPTPENKSMLKVIRSNVYSQNSSKQLVITVCLVLDLSSYARPILEELETTISCKTFCPIRLLKTDGTMTSRESSSSPDKFDRFVYSDFKYVRSIQYNCTVQQQTIRDQCTDLYQKSPPI